MTGVMIEEKVSGTVRDEALIKAGTHFYCFGHYCAQPIEEQSYDPSFCLACLENRPFSDARDRALIKAGTHFYCEGHLCAIPIGEQSDDPRYCRSCREFLRQEAESLKIRGAWVPKLTGKRRGKAAAIDKSHTAPQASHTPSIKGDIIPDHITIPPTGQRQIMSTPKTPKTEGDKTAPRVMVKKRRGPKHKSLPVDEIKRWAKKDGMRSKRIAARLEKKRGIKVSYKTIQRILNGQRVMEL